MAEKLFKNLNIRSLTIGVPGGLKTKAFIPVLLHLARKTLQPPAVDDPVENRKQYRTDRIMEPFIELLRPQGMNSPAVGTSVAFYPDSFRPAFKISLHIAVTPETTSLTSWALLRPWPTKYKMLAKRQELG